MEEASKELQTKIGLSISDLIKIPQGEITFAIVEKPARKKALSVVLLIDYGDNQATIDKLLDNMDKMLKQSNATLKKQDYNEVSLNTVPSAAKGPGDNNPIETFYFTEDKYFVLATEVDALKAVVDRWDGKNEKTLATHPVYSKIAGKCEAGDTEAAMKWFLNPVGLFQMRNCPGAPRSGWSGSRLPAHSGTRQLEGSWRCELFRS